MKKIFLIMLILFFITELFAVREIVQTISYQSSSIEIYNINISTTPIKIIDKTETTRFFIIQNYTTYDLYISTSSNFSTYFIIPSKTAFSSNILCDIYGKFLSEVSETINVFIEK